MSNKPGGWQGAVFAPCFIRDQGLLCLAQRTEETMKKGRTHNKAVLKKYFPVYLMAFPGLLYLFINNYMPLPGLVLAFKKYNAKKGIWGSSWVGLKNFKFLFATNDAFIITRNTLFYNIVFIIVNTVAAIAVAIILAEMRHKIKKFYQSAILLPYMLSVKCILALYDSGMERITQLFCRCHQRICHIQIRHCRKLDRCILTARTFHPHCSGRHNDITTLYIQIDSAAGTDR